MYRDLKRLYWWTGMKNDIVEFMAKCQNFQQGKYKHQRPTGLLQRMPIPKWKWERIAMDFVSRQKKYADHKVRDMAFQIGEKVLLNVSPMKGVMIFGKKGMFSPRYTGPFEILEYVGPVANRLALTPNLSGVHLGPVAILDRDVRKLRTKDIRYVKVQWKHHPIEEATWQTEKDMRDKYPSCSSIQELDAILDHDVRKLRTKGIKSMKFQWKHRPGEEATWEIEKDMRDKYPQLFVDSEKPSVKFFGPEYFLVVT
ncbi:hypothetical protein MTR67_012154 [Solanum verrucosum]|uniref:Chromo domain-containing protein n=1 Tax=Solanum verrucosum TaxID=315347 RepID=A0AAF0QF74_SOLVR|nr:hypothetical protein MTR67_012154 [Solanum verrucosum]